MYNIRMKSVISVSNMRQSDQKTIEAGTPSLTLMLRAARGIREAYSYPGITSVVTGSGNNGGDGFALAYLLATEGKPVRIFTVSDHFSEDAGYYMEKCRELGVPVSPLQPDSLAGSDTIADCLLGTGFKGDVKDTYRQAIDQINRSDAFVVSADINSGMNGDSGEYITAVRSDITVTIGNLKAGLMYALIRRDPALGRLICAQIGIAPAYEENYLLSDDEWESEGFPEGAYVHTKDGHICFRGDVPFIEVTD